MSDLSLQKMLDLGKIYPEAPRMSKPVRTATDAAVLYGAVVAVSVILLGTGGVAAEPVNVSDADDLRNVSEDLSGSYVLVDDIDLLGEGFEPIGDTDSGFVGRFNGNGHVVTNLTVEAEEGYAGLFGAVGENGTVENVGVENASISGSGGGLVGFNAGTVAESYITGEVTGDEPVGGVVGVHKGVIARSYSAADVAGNRTVGGLAGLAHADPRGIVPGTRPDTEFAFVESYAVGEVTGEKRVGGVVGQMSLGPEDLRVVNESVYWDTEATGQESDVGRFDGGSYATMAEGLTTSEMTGEDARESMRGFDFGGAWRVGDGYPELAQRDQPSEVEVDDPERVPEDGWNGAEDEGDGDEEDDEVESVPGFTFTMALVAVFVLAWRRSYEASAFDFSLGLYD